MKDQTIKLSIKDKSYSVFIRNGVVAQIHSTGGKSLAYIDIKVTLCQSNAMRMRH